MSVQEQEVTQKRSVLFAVQGVGARVDVVRTLIEASSDGVAVTVLGDSKRRLIFDPLELRRALD